MQSDGHMQQVQVPRNLPRGTASGVLECNLRLVTSASGRVAARRLRIRTANSGADLPASVCSKLRRERGLVVAPLHASAGELIALQAGAFAQTEVAGEEWRAELRAWAA